MAERAPRLVVVREVSARAGALVAEALLAIERGARLAIPGGSALAALAPARARLGARWSELRLTWVDERCVPFEHADSNRGAAYRSAALDRAQPPALELALFEDGETPEQARARVAHAWSADFDSALDVVLLGLGEDGHVASLFPGRTFAPGPVAYVDASPKPPARRITLTREALCTSRATILVAHGEAKRAALEHLLADDASLPTHGLPGLIVVTDLGGLA